MIQALGVDFNILDARELAVTKFALFFFVNDLENQGQTFIVWMRLCQVESLLQESL